jgi:peptide chain release factor subunit 1
MIAYIIEPIEPIKSFLYRCDSSFYLDPLEAMLGHKDVYGLIVVDRSEATIGLLRGTHIETVKNIESRVPSKHHQGGQSSRRFERLIEQAANDFFRKVGEKANEIFLDENIKGIFIGGPGATKEYFAQKDYLHHELKKKVVDLYDAGYTDEYGLREVVDKATSAIQDLDLSREKNLMQQFLVEVKKVDGGLAVYGEKEVHKALERGAVDTLLISEAMRKYSLLFQCPECGNTKNVTTTDDKIGMRCEKCNIEMDIKEKHDLIETFYNLAEDYSTKIELISEESEEGNLLLRAFGGIVGILRYKI